MNRPLLNIDYLGGSAWGSIGGIQTFNRALLEVLLEKQWLQRGYLTNDKISDIPEAFRAHMDCGSHSKVKLLFWSLSQCFRSRDILFSDHLNYSPILKAIPGKALRMVTVHAFEMETLIHPLRLKSLKSMDAVFCVSQYARSLAIKIGVPEKKLYVCYHGLEIEASESKAPPVSDAPPKILFVGRLDRHYKGQEHLIEAAALLKARGVRFEMLFAGGGKKLPQFKTMAVDAGVDDCVSFLGFVPDGELAQLYREADVFALPSSGEGFGLVYLEAMANHLPCLACKQGAAPEVVIDGECGYCVEYGDVEAIAGYLQELIEKPELRVRFGENARRRYLEHFTKEAFRRRVQDLIGSLVEAHRKVG